MLAAKNIKTLFVASDHGGLDMKQHLIHHFPTLPWQDLGTETSSSVDYPDYAKKLCLAMKPELEFSRGILVCGSGQGMVIQANRYPFIRAALCWNEEITKLARQHNDANVLCLPGRMLAFPLAEQMLTLFLDTDFEGGRHQPRVDKLST